MATSRSEEKIHRLQTKQVDAFTFSLGDTFPNKIIAQTAVILSIPPGRRNTKLEDYVANMKLLIAQFAKQQPYHLVFISTTSVYGTKQNGQITESAAVAPETASAKAHVEIENSIRTVLPNSHTILRLAGLVGPDRHPINTLAGKSLTAPNQVVNLIHSVDVITALLKLLTSKPSNTTLHLSALEHPQRKAYYEYCAQQRDLSLPVFTPNSDALPSIGKQIDATNTLQQLAMALAYASPFDML